jgi:glycosyltransferase involved in cell wall biosynthesis
VARQTAGIRSNLPALSAAGYRFTVVSERVSWWRNVREELQVQAFGLVHAHGLTAAAHACLGRLGATVPLVVSLHEPLRPSRFAGLRGQARRWLLGRALARADAVIVPSDDSRDSLLRFFPNLRRQQDRVHTIPNGIDTDLGDAGDLRRELNLDDESALIGCIGPFVADQGFPLLIEAVARLVRCGGVPDFHIVALGAAPDALHRDIAQKGLTEYFSFHDVESPAAVLPHLDLLVVPSVWEAAPQVAMEALAAGVPVLGSDTPGLREVLEGTPARMVRAGEVTELEVGLREALLWPWTTEAQAYAETARRRFDHGPAARRLVELYDRMTAA